MFSATFKLDIRYRGQPDSVCYTDFGDTVNDVDRNTDTTNGLNFGLVASTGTPVIPNFINGELDFSNMLASGYIYLLEEWIG